MLRFWVRAALGLVAGLLGAAPPALACSLCYNIRQTPTFRQDAAQAQAVIYGPISNPRLSAGANGTTDFHVEEIVKPHADVAGKKLIELPRYLAVTDPKEPPHYLIFCEINEGKLDPYRGVPVKSVKAARYLAEALRLDPKNRTESFLFFFKYLEDPDQEVARDAYLEFAKANDQEIGEVGGKLSAAKLRTWIKDAQTPAERLGLYAFLLGACGGDEDAALLRSLLQESSERTLAAYDGLLGGYIRLRPKEGWDLAATLLRDDNKPFAVRFAVLRTLRFYHGWKPDETRAMVLRGMEAIITQGELADLAIEDLRRWQTWDLTQQVLARWGQKGSESPIVRRAIVRYALSCPNPEGVGFVTNLRKQDPDLVKDVEESIQFEKQK